MKFYFNKVEKVINVSFVISGCLALVLGIVSIPDLGFGQALMISLILFGFISIITIITSLLFYCIIIFTQYILFSFRLFLNNINSIYVIPYAVIYLATFQLVKNPAAQIVAYILLGLVFGFIGAFSFGNKNTEKDVFFITVLAAFCSYLLVNLLDLTITIGNNTNPMQLASAGMSIQMEQYCTKFSLFFGLLLSLVIFAVLSLIFGLISKLGFQFGSFIKLTIYNLPKNKGELIFQDKWVAFAGAILAALITSIFALIGILLSNK